MAPETSRPQAETRIITVGEQRLRVAIRSGNSTRTPLLLVNGIGVNFEVLQPFVDALDPAIEVLRFDVPGTGGSPAPRIPYRFSAHARLVTKMLDQLGYQQVDVLGVSWGGALAQQFAFQYPRRCRRLILVSTGTGALMVPGRPWVLAKIATPRRYRDPTHMAQIAGEIYGGKVHKQPELAHEFAQTVRLGSMLGYFYQLLGGVGRFGPPAPWLRGLRGRAAPGSRDRGQKLPAGAAALAAGGPAWSRPVATGSARHTSAGRRDARCESFRGNDPGQRFYRDLR